jgi:hypothetical protein
MSPYEVFVAIWTLIVNSLASIFRPLPDMRYKFLLDKSFVSDSDKEKNTLCPVHLVEDFGIEIEIDGKIQPLLSFKKEGNKLSLCGLPVVAHHNMKIIITDTLLNETLETYSYNKGQIINYSKIIDSHNLIDYDH